MEGKQFNLVGIDLPAAPGKH